MLRPMNASEEERKAIRNQLGYDPAGKVVDVETAEYLLKLEDKLAFAAKIKKKLYEALKKCAERKSE